MPIPTQRSLAGGEGAKKSPDGNLAAVTRRRIEEVRKVVAGGEILPFAAKDDDPDRRILARLLDRIRQRGVHGDGDGVAPFRPVERDREDRVPFLDPDMLAHSPLLRIW